MLVLLRVMQVARAVHQTLRLPAPPPLTLARTKTEGNKLVTRDSACPTLIKAVL